MKKTSVLLTLALATGGRLVAAKDDPPTGDAKAKTDTGSSTLRYAKVYADAVAEAKDRGCVVFLTFHGDG